MSDTFATEAKPPYAVFAWMDDFNIFVEIPVKDQAPFIAKYRNDAQGFEQALRAMREYHRAVEAPPKYTPPIRPVKPLGARTTTQAKAADILRRMGITG